MSKLKNEIIDILESSNELLTDPFDDGKYIYGIPQDSISPIANKLIKYLEPIQDNVPLFNCNNGLHMVDKTCICVNCGIDVRELK